MHIQKLEEIDKYGLVKDEGLERIKYRIKGNPDVYLCVYKKACKGEIVIDSSTHSLIGMAQKKLTRIEHALDRLTITVKKMIEDGVITEEKDS